MQLVTLHAARTFLNTNESFEATSSGAAAEEVWQRGQSLACDAASPETRPLITVGKSERAGRGRTKEMNVYRSELSDNVSVQKGNAEAVSVGVGGCRYWHFRPLSRSLVELELRTRRLKLRLIFSKVSISIQLPS